MTSRQDNQGLGPIGRDAETTRRGKVRSHLAEPRVAPNPDADERGRAILLSSRSPADAVARLANGDCLRLVERSAVRLKQLALLMDCERVAEHAACVVARAKLTRDTPFEDWIATRLDEAIDDLLTLDAQRYVKGQKNGGDDYSFMLLMLGIPDEGSLEAAVRFNSQPLRTRKCFDLLLVDHWSIAECLEAGFGPLEDLTVRAQTGMAALLGCVPRRVKLPKGAGDFTGEIR